MNTRREYANECKCKFRESKKIFSVRSFFFHKILQKRVIKQNDMFLQSFPLDVYAQCIQNIECVAKQKYEHAKES